MTSFSLEEIFRGQAIHVAVFVGIGLLMGVRERKAPARKNDGYDQGRMDVAAVLVTFVGASSFGVLIAFLRSLEFLKPLQTLIGSLPWFVLIIGTSLIADFLNYWSHRFLHTERMWRFHRWHHSPRHLFWFSGFRGSFVHLFVLALKTILLLSISDLNPWVLGTLAVQGMSAQMLGHVNFDVQESILGRVFVLPQYHRIHHAVDRDKHDANFGFVYTFWDKMFGTQILPASASKDFELGLPKSEKLSLWQMLVG